MLGKLDQFAYRSDEFVNSFWREGCLATLRANPGIDIRNANRDIFLTVLESGRTPFFFDAMFATNRGRFTCLC